jgi:Mg-chelatase subunit ChlD/tetratricopeptide (TPR) repeat protein
MNREELEARVVALVLGEASAFEEADLHRQIEKNAELEAFYLEMLEVHGALEMAHDTSVDSDWKLSETRRKLVFGSLEGGETVSVDAPPMEQPKKRRSWLWSVAAVVTIGFVLATLSYGPVMKQVDTEVKKAPEIVSYSFSADENYEEYQIVNEVTRVPSAPSAPPSVIASSVDKLNAPSLPSEVAFGDVALEFEEAMDFEDGFGAAGGAARDDVAAGVFGSVSDDPFADPVEAPSSQAEVAKIAGMVEYEEDHSSYFGQSADRALGRSRSASVRKGKKATELPQISATPLPKNQNLPRIKLSGSIGSLRENSALDVLNLQSVPNNGSEIDTESLRKHLYRSEGYYNLGQFDEAEEEYREVLRIDRYNKAARRGLERIASAKSDYHQAAYDQTRAELLKQVDTAWELGIEAKGEVYEKPSNTNQVHGEEIARRVSTVQEADSALLEGRKLYAEQDYQASITQYKKALSLLPSGPAAQDRRHAFTGYLVDAYTALAGHYTRKGSYADAKKLVEEVLKVDPSNTSAKLLKETLEKESTKTDEIDAAEQSHSTFSLNVSDASFKLARSVMLEKGGWPDAAGVRTEEFINAFDYQDPKPSMVERVACAQDQVIHPFLQQRNLLRLSMSTAALGRKAPLNLVILVDNSGSMERPDRVAIVTKALETLAQELGPNDKVSVMSFSRETRLLADRWSGARAAELVEVVANRASEGGTNIEQAIRVAGKHLKGQLQGGVQERVVVLTDGAANLGDADPESLKIVVEELREKGIAFDACGIGADGLDDGILEALTRKGDGRYYVLESVEAVAENFATQIAGALNPAAKNVKVQVVFNPQRVGKYKLLGFEKHRLKKEDFRNDSVDAAELAAEESGSSLYQIQVKPEGEGAVGTVFVRFQDMASGQMIERNWTIPYLTDTPALKAAKPVMQLATVAALLGEKLHHSDAGSVDFGRLRSVLGDLKLHYANNQKVLDLIRMAEMTIQ